ncbi:MAG: adenosylhomocysteinase [Bacteroidales bacterium]|nr:adenosylhomocysteinase [Bacteroidales bacterium]
MDINSVIAANYSENEFPACMDQTRRWSVNRPLEGLTVLDVTPIFRNTLVKHRALIAAGARLIVGRSSMIPCDEKIVRLLSDNGIRVVDSSEGQAGEVDFVMDCAGAFNHWKPKVGYVELTKSGVSRYEGCDRPVFVADSGRIKKIETSFGTGESYFRAMKQLGYSLPAESKIVIFGSGKVGTGLLAYASRNGLKPTVVTMPETVNGTTRSLADEIVDCNEIERVAAVVADAFAVVTATGVAGALSHPVLVEALEKSGAVIANMGVEDEFGPGMPAERVLEGKKPLNFILEEPTHLKYIDATMALHNEGAIHLLEHPEAEGLIDPPAEMEEKLLNITCERGVIGDEIREYI